jgi:hypothetical protein
MKNKLKEIGELIIEALIQIAEEDLSEEDEKMKVTILETDDWEAIYINNKLIKQGHTIESGDKLYLLKLAEEYKFKSSDVKIIYVTQEDEEILHYSGLFPKDINELNGIY